MLSVIVVVALLAFWWFRAGRYIAGRWTWEPPPSTVLSSPMQEPPSPGWRTTLSDLGIPESAEGLEPSRLAASTDPQQDRALVGQIGDKAFLLAQSPGPHWWLAGIDVRSGRTLFPAVQLASARPPRCFLNGPQQLLCLDSQDDRSFTAVVIDTSSGGKLYNGPTDVGYGIADLPVQRVGIYAVARDHDRGLYGIGPRAETTWFVPGDGSISSATGFSDIPGERAIATQGNANPRVWDTTVFSLSDGEVIHPDVDEDARLRQTAAYPGGFAASVKTGQEFDGVLFFDTSGHRVGGGGIDGSLLGAAIDLPVISFSPEEDAVIFSPTADRLLSLPALPYTRIGTIAFVNEATSLDFPEWRQYNLKTGEKGPACDFPLHNYIGTDGSVLVFEVTNREAGLLAKAYDLATCELLWKLPSAANSLARIWRVNTTLIQLSADGTELSSLVAPG